MRKWSGEEMEYTCTMTMTATTCRRWRASMSLSGQATHRKRTSLWIMFKLKFIAPMIATKKLISSHYLSHSLCHRRRRRRHRSSSAQCNDEVEYLCCFHRCHRCRCSRFSFHFCPLCFLGLFLSLSPYRSISILYIVCSASYFFFFDGLFFSLLLLLFIVLIVSSLWLSLRFKTKWKSKSEPM